MEVPPIALIVDMFGTEAFAVAEELMMLKYVCITSNAWFLALTVHAPNLDKQVGHFVDCFKQFLRRNEVYFCMGTEISTADGILVNTFHELEPQTLAALSDTRKLGPFPNAPIYPIGPLVRLI